MKKFLAIIVMCTNMMHAMEEFLPAKENVETKTTIEAIQLWHILGQLGNPDLKFLSALEIIRPSRTAIKWAMLTQECKAYLADLQHKLGQKLIDLLKKSVLTTEDTGNVKLLIFSGANLDMRDSSSTNMLHNATPLIIAACCNFKKIAKWLIKAGADLNMRAQSGNTALILAAWFGNKHITKLLLSAGADVNIKDNEGNTALMHSVLSSCGNAKQHKTIKLLIDANSDLDARNNQDLTVLHCTAFWGKTDVAAQLIHAGASINIPVIRRFGILVKSMTALDMAEKCGKPELIDLFRENGAVSGSTSFCSIS